MMQHKKRPVAAVGVIVVRGDRILLVRRGKPPRKGIWTLPGGAIEWGESAEQAARREVREECGIEIEVDRVLDVVDLIDTAPKGTASPFGAAHHYVVVEFLARYRSGKLQASSDAADARWVFRPELSGYALSEDVIRLIALGFSQQAA